MKIKIFENSKETEEAMVAHVMAAIEQKTDLVLGTATGSSPLGVYSQLAEAVKAGRLSLSQVRTFQLDEYVGLPEGHEQSYRYFIDKNLVETTDLKRENSNVPNPHLVGTPGVETLEDACKAYEELIASVGGIDYQILGIGSDGHIAFNEPGGLLDSRTHVEQLAKETIEDNSRFFDGDISRVPTQCITQGLGTIMEAHQIGMIVIGKNKAKAVRDMIQGPISSDCPASVLQNHPDCTIFLTKDAAALLSEN